MTVRSGRGGSGDPAARRRFGGMRTLRAAVDSLFQREAPAAILVPSSRAYGILRGGGAPPAGIPQTAERFPSLVVAGAVRPDGPERGARD
jgi:hypothetical protein